MAESLTVASATENVAFDDETLTEPVAEVLQDVAPRKKANRDPAIKERCKALYFQGVRNAIISAQTGVAEAVIRAWASKGKWHHAVNEAKALVAEQGVRVLSIQPAPASGASNALRDTFANVLQKAASKLAEIDPKKSLKEIRKVGKALEPLVRSGKIVHGWGNESSGGVVVAELLGHERETQSSIAIAADVQQVSCGQDTTTGSVPAACGSEEKPQDTSASVTTAQNP